MADIKVNAEAALKEVTDMCISACLKLMDDNAYMQERAADIKDVAKRIWLTFAKCDVANPSMINEEVVLSLSRFDTRDTAH